MQLLRSRVKLLCDLRSRVKLLICDCEVPFIKNRTLENQDETDSTLLLLRTRYKVKFLKGYLTAKGLKDRLKVERPLCFTPSRVSRFWWELCRPSVRRRLLLLGRVFPYLRTRYYNYYYYHENARIINTYYWTRSVRKPPKLTSQLNMNMLYQIFYTNSSSIWQFPGLNTARTFKIETKKQ